MNYDTNIYKPNLMYLVGELLCIFVKKKSFTYCYEKIIFMDTRPADGSKQLIIAGIKSHRLCFFPL